MNAPIPSFRSQEYFQMAFIRKKVFVETKGLLHQLAPTAHSVQPQKLMEAKISVEARIFVTENEIFSISNISAIFAEFCRKFRLYGLKLSVTA